MQRSERHWGGVVRRNHLIILGSAVVTAAIAAVFTWHVSGLPTHRPDFAMMWRALQLPNPYDRAALDAALHWEAKYPVAFVYPPTALPIFGLFSLLTLRAALTLWATLSAASLALAARSKWTPLLLLTPSLLWAIPGGQTSVLIGSILLGSLLLLRDRPWLSGVLLGVALSLKPQLALAFPLLLLIDRRWHALIAAIGTFLGAALLSAVLFGPLEWVEWIRSLPGFIDLHASNPLLRRNEIALGLPLWLRACAIAIGAWASARALQRGNRVEAFVIASCAGLIGSAHAMGYEFAMLAPACPALIAKRGWAASAIFLFLLIPGFIWFGLPAFPSRLVAVLALWSAAAFDGVFAERPRSEPAPAAMPSDRADRAIGAG